MHEENREWLLALQRKLQRIVDSGTRVLERMIGAGAPQEGGAVRTEEDLEELELTKPQLTRRFRRTEVAEQLGITPAAISNAEGAGRLPSPDMKLDSAGRPQHGGYTLAQILKMREVFGKEKHRPAESPAMTIGLLNLKGGSHKTTMTLHLAQALAIRGYRALLIDTDPQGSLSLMMGHRPDLEVDYEDTIAPFILEDVETLESAYGPGAHQSLRYAVRETHWPNIDIIPSCMANLRIDLELQVKLRAEEMAATAANIEYSRAHSVEKLRSGVETIADDYDFVIFDGTPSLNLSTMNVVTACDLVVVPTPSQLVDYASTLQFTGLMEETIDAYEKQQFYPMQPDVVYAITKTANSDYSRLMCRVIRKTMGADGVSVLDSEIGMSDEIGKHGTNVKSIYEINPGETNNRDALKRTLRQYNDFCDELLEKHVKPFWGVEPEVEVGEEEEPAIPLGTVHRKLIEEGVI